MQTGGKKICGASGQPPLERAAYEPLGIVRRHEQLGGLLNHYERKAA
jgi:hypothetical protein